MQRLTSADAESLLQHDFQTARVGRRLPPATLAEWVGDGPAAVRAERLFAGRRAVVVGVPGAFTPVCTGRHVPAFVASAAKLRASGFSLLACIAPNDPWTLRRWAEEVDPAGELRFLSDGNLHFTRALGLCMQDEAHFLGERSKRYSMIVEDAVIRRISVEESIFDVGCSAAEQLLLD
ncbi:MAG: redoxin family protein [Hyphomonadaceae bacterium]